MEVAEVIEVILKCCAVGVIVGGGVILYGWTKHEVYNRRYTNDVYQQRQDIEREHHKQRRALRKENKQLNKKPQWKKN